MWKTVQQGLAVILVVSGLVLGGCTPDRPAATTSPDASAASPTASPSPAERQTSASVTPSVSEQLPRLTGKAVVEMVVKGNKVTIEVDGDKAPVTAGNFVDLVNRGVYNGLMFHRVVREPEPFVVQGGDPNSKGEANPQTLGTGSFTDPATGKPRYIPLEITPAGADQPLYHQTFPDAGIDKAPALPHTRGAIAMARSRFPDSASSQFYFALADLEFLDGSYAVFGYVTDGMDVVDQIQQGDRIESMQVVSGLDNLKNGGQ